MTRPLANHGLSGVSHLSLAIGSVFLCAFTLFMCAGHSRKWVHRLKACYSYDFEEPVIQLNNENMIHGFHDDDTEEEEEEEPSVWQKNILMGGKCQLPDFSGVIIYDSEGNIAPQKPRILALTVFMCPDQLDLIESDEELRPLNSTAFSFDRDFVTLAFWPAVELFRALLTTGRFGLNAWVETLPVVFFDLENAATLTDLGPGELLLVGDLENASTLTDFGADELLLVGDFNGLPGLATGEPLLGGGFADE